MKQSTTWCTRGAQPKRSVQAALFAAAQGYIEALTNGKQRPWLYAMTRATSAAVAMNEHRLAARSKANARGSEYADLTADAINRLLELPSSKALPSGNQPTISVTR